MVDNPMAKTDAQIQINAFPTFFRQVRADHAVELIGAGILLTGLAALLSLRADAGVPWLVRMTGWTAPLIVVSTVVTGGVMLFRRQAGYWSAEALLGIETLLLSLMAATALATNPAMSWDMAREGGGGGLMGTALGGLLTAGLGRMPALVITGCLGALGLYWLVRYTPLIYAPVYAARLAPIAWIYMRWFVEERLIRRSWPAHEHAATPVHTGNFVSPYDPVEEMESEIAPAARRARQVGARRSARPHSAALSRKQRRGALPSLDLLTQDAGVYGGGDVRPLEQMIERTLSDFNVPVRVVHVESGPTVTQFGVEPLFLESPGQRRKVRVNRIVSLADDLALALAAKSVRIEAPVPGRPYVGIEVPNRKKMRVALRGILESPAMSRQNGRLQIALGRDTSGSPVVMDLTQAPHLLIAGATGSGKSVSINAIITSLLMQHSPNEVQFVMVDPKMVELPGYNGIPHLIGKVITDMDQVMGALTWLMLQMDDRYRLFREAGVRNIAGYNELAAQRSQGRSAPKPLPYIVLVVDELADLMMTAAEDVERQICRLAQMARATGIHLILATQRPSTDVVTGLIKANFPSRIAFAVTSQVDSRVILDQPGAERLLGQGDMLLMRSDAAKLFRLQGCFVSDDEISRVVSFWRGQADPDEPPAIPPWNGLLDQMDQEEEGLLDAIDLVRGMRTCSTSMLQRKLRVGYPKAARLMEQLEARGVVGPDMGGGQGREVLLKDEDEREMNYEDEDLL
jgi:S-DNA-T family DNA segregation ATPase FtsK/SpoIIIE